MVDYDEDAFYIVRKGDLMGIYKSLGDCEMLNPTATVYKGYGLPKEAEDYLVSNGLKNSSITVSASQVKDGLFGSLMVCPFQQPCSTNTQAVQRGSYFQQSPSQISSDKEPVNMGTSGALNPPIKRSKLDDFVKLQAAPSTRDSCTIEFDGASKGNPGLAGAGAILRAEDGSMVLRLQEGVGIATNNVAEYRAVLLGLKQALKEGFKHVRVQGDSLLVCNQIQGLWKCKNANMAQLCKEAVELKKKLSSFKIQHVLREFNSEADAQANLAIMLKDGEVRVDSIKQ